MHQAVADFVSGQAKNIAGPCRVLDIGGRRVSTDRYYDGPYPKDLFPQAIEYVIMDLEPGPDVDIVADATTLDEGRMSMMDIWETFDVVVCTEVLEHVERWPVVIQTCYRALRPGGRLILTCAAPGRTPHAGFHEAVFKPREEYYANVSHMELRKVLEQVGFRDIVTYQVGLDTQAVAVK